MLAGRQRFAVVAPWPHQAHRLFIKYRLALGTIRIDSIPRLSVKRLAIAVIVAFIDRPIAAAPPVVPLGPGNSVDGPLGEHGPQHRERQAARLFVNEPFGLPPTLVAAAQVEKLVARAREPQAWL